MRKFLTRAKKIALSDYGRNSIWSVELNGEVIAKLSDANFKDMFWFSYKITFLNKENIISSNSQSWCEDSFKFKSEYLSEYAENAFSNDMLIDGRVTMRALYVKPKNQLETFFANIFYYYSQFMKKKNEISFKKTENTSRINFLKQARKLAFSNYGRNSIWLVESDGEVIAKLSDAIPTYGEVIAKLSDANVEDMFWFSYKIDFLNKENIVSLNPQSWWDNDFKFKNEYLSEYAENPFSNEVLVGGRVTMRGLYIKPKNKFEEFLVSLIPATIHTLKEELRIIK